MDTVRYTLTCQDELADCCAEAGEKCVERLYFDQPPPPPPPPHSVSKAKPKKKNTNRRLIYIYIYILRSNCMHAYIHSSQQ